MRESCNTGCKRPFTVIINQCHFSSFIIIFIMHVMNQVQYINIYVCQPVHPPVKFLNHFIIICIFRSNALHSRTTLNSVFFIKTTVKCIQQCFCQVGAGTEELNLLPCLGCGYTAADGVIISPFRFHNFVILILDGTGINRDLCCIFLEALWKTRAVQHGQIWFRAWSHVFQCMQETIICLCYHMSSVQAGSTYFQCYPGRITGE